MDSMPSYRIVETSFASRQGTDPYWMSKGVARRPFRRYWTVAIYEPYAGGRHSWPIECATEASLKSRRCQRIGEDVHETKRDLLNLLFGLTKLRRETLVLPTA